MDLDIDSVDCFQTENNKSVMKIRWYGSKGFGEYTLIFDDDESIIAESEGMDINDNKSFLKKLMNIIVEKVNIAE